MQDWQPPADSAGHLIKRLNIALIVISSITIILRLNVRAFILRSLGWDDLIATIAFVFTIAFSSLEIYSVSVGLGTHLSEIPPQILDQFLKAVLANALLFFIGIAMVRFSVIAFYIKLSSERWYRWGLYSLAFTTFSITVVTLIYSLTECQQISELWDIKDPNRQCAPKSQERRMWWAHSFIGTAIDLGLLILPLSLLYARMRSSHKMIKVVLIFCVGIFAVVAGILRVVHGIMVDVSTDLSYKMAIIAPWGDLECHVGLWVACFPSLQPLFKLINQKFDIRSKKRSQGKKASTQVNDCPNRVGPDVSNSSASRASFV